MEKNKQTIDSPASDERTCYVVLSEELGVKHVYLDKDRADKECSLLNQSSEWDEGAAISWYVDTALLHTSAFTDTDRLNYLLQFIRIDDVGDEEYCKGIVVDNEKLEDKVRLGPEGSDQILRGTIHGWNDDLRDVIDRAMATHSFLPNTELNQRQIIGEVSDTKNNNNVYTKKL